MDIILLLPIAFGVMEKRTVIIVLSAITVVLALISFFVLPDNAVMQIGPDGKPYTYGSKFLAILLPMLLSVAGIYLYYRERDGIKISFIILSVAGFAVSIFFLLLNL